MLKYYKVPVLLIEFNPEKVRFVVDGRCAVQKTFWNAGHEHDILVEYTWHEHEMEHRKAYGK